MAPVALRSVIAIVSSGSVIAQIVPPAIPSGLGSVLNLGLPGAALLACWVLWRALVEERRVNAAAMAEERKSSAAAIAIKDKQNLEMMQQVTQLLSAMTNLQTVVKELRDREEHGMGKRRQA